MKTTLRRESPRYKFYFLKIKKLYQKPIFKASTNFILTLLMICFFALFAIRPALTTIAKLKKELKEKQSINQKLEKKITALNQAQKNYAQLAESLGLIDLALPEKVEFTPLATKINFLSYTHNLKLTSISFGKFDLLSSEILPSKREVRTKANVLNIDLAVNGSFADIKNFLKDLGNLDRIVKIKSVSFSSKGTDEIGVSLAAEAFWLPQEEKAEKNETN